MSYETAAYDNHHGDPIAIVMATGTHDVSRLVHLLSGHARANCEQLGLGDQLLRQVRQHYAGRAALKLLREHGGPDLLERVQGGFLHTDHQDLTDAERVALPAEYHRPVFDGLGEPHSWICAACWGEDFTSAWPCRPAIAGGVKLAQAMNAEARS